MSDMHPPAPGNAELPPNERDLPLRQPSTAHMEVVVDEPFDGQSIDTLPLRVRGWVWLGRAHPMLETVEVWAGDSRLGAVRALHPRPDVAAHLDLAPEENVGFDLLVQPNMHSEDELQICVKLKTTGGSLMGPFCTRRVRINARHNGSESERPEVRIVMDRPTVSQVVDGSGFVVAGWVWYPGNQDAIDGIEAWSGPTRLGGTDRLSPRVDVSGALGLDENAAVGFNFRVVTPPSASEIPLALHIRMRTGAFLGPFCATSLRVGTDLAAALDAKNEEVAAAHRVVAQLQQQVRHLRAELSQRESPVPPDHLQIRQIGCVTGPLFYEKGASLSANIADAFASTGMDLRSAKRVLDFGCGCGRVLVGVRNLGIAGEVWGTDIDREAIEWNQAHIGRHGQFAVNEAMPPLQFPDAYFDAIYSVSVFTHLPEDMQFAWLAELRRVLAPGGTAVLSVHGRRYWRDVHADVRRTVETRGFDYRSAQKTDGLPDFYMVAFHSEQYIRDQWCRYFDVVGVKEEAIAGAHDAVLLRRRAE